MRKRVTFGTIIGTIIGALLFIGGIIVIVLNIDANTAFPAIGGIILGAIGGSTILCVWFPIGGSVSSFRAASHNDDFDERKAQRKAERDILIAAMMIDGELHKKDEKHKKENVWEDNSEDNDDADPDNW